MALPVAGKDSQYLMYERLQPISTLIDHDAWPNVVDAALPLILRMRCRACHFLV